MPRKIRFLFSSAVLLSFLPNALWAQDFVQDPLPQYVCGTPHEKIFELLKPLIRKKLSRNDLKTFDAIDFSFPRTANYLHVAAAKTKKGKRAVEISYGFLCLNQTLILGLYEETVFHPKKSYLSYLSYIASRNGQDSLRYLNGGPLPMYPLYGAWAGIPPTESEALEEKYKYSLSKGYTAVLLFSVLHETAHHINNDVDRLDKQVSDSALRDQEYKADIFAFEKMRALGYNPSSLAPFFLLMTLFEGDINRISGTHDPSICRLAKIGLNFDSFSPSTEDPSQEMLRQILIRCDRK